MAKQSSQARLGILTKDIVMLSVLLIVVAVTLWLSPELMEYADDRMGCQFRYTCNPMSR